jgi:hypothetical protein
MEWDETTFESGVRIPLVLTRSKYYSGLEFGNYVGLTKVSSFQNRITNGDSVVYDGPGRIALLLYRPDTTLAYVFKDQFKQWVLVLQSFLFFFLSIVKAKPKGY